MEVALEKMSAVRALERAPHEKGPEMVKQHE
jgi:hypothetical protein